VLAVWVAVTGDGRGGGDPQRILADPRVTQLHDPDLKISRWFGHRDHSFHAGRGLAWDAFMLFDADATFATSSSHLETSGRTIIADHQKLRDALTIST
jgi:hypothetical protein